MQISKENLSYNLKLSLFTFVVFGSIFGIGGKFIFDELYLLIFNIFFFLLIRPSLKFKINFFIIFLIFLLFKALTSSIKYDLELKYLRYCVLYFSILIFYFFNIEKFIKQDTKIIILTLGCLLIIVNGFLLDFTELSNIEFGQAKYQLVKDEIPRRFWNQGIFIVGSSYFAIMALYLLYLISFVQSQKNFLIFLLIICLGLYYESRFIFLACLFFLPFFFNKKNFVYFALFCIVILIYDYIFTARVVEYIKLYVINYIDLLNFKFNQDQSRIDDIKIAIDILLSKDIYTITFGTTFQDHKILMGEYFNRIDGIYRTSTLGAIIIDTGILGLVILTCVFIELFFKIIFSQKNLKFVNIARTLILIFLLIISLNTTFALESVLFFLIIGNFENQKINIFYKLKNNRLYK